MKKEGENYKNSSQIVNPIKYLWQLKLAKLIDGPTLSQHFANLAFCYFQFLLLEIQVNHSTIANCACHVMAYKSDCSQKGVAQWLSVNHESNSSLIFKVLRCVQGQCLYYLSCSGSTSENGILSRHD